ncbi:MAG: Ldh family oxidoreductase [Cyclobacteriaceae bacterium]|nr:Ldh family oxidoreductase [Cyclobacteriaceae bacterium]MCH8516311.1 Ldh family oxidoreductase [Cyclobacteriaceae bacterium]
MSESVLYTHDALSAFCRAVILSMGCSSADAQQAADVLLSADLRGVDSHGLARLSGYYRLFEKGRINPMPQMKIIHESPSTATLDADAALGLVSAPHAMRIAMKKAKQCGSGWVAVQNSNHFGIAGYHAMMALEQDMIGFALTNASPLVAPTYSKERLLGTNPISMAVPAGEHMPFVADLATTTAANGKLEILQRKKQPMPIGWAQDAFGENTDNPFAVKEGGALLPLGGHKGFCLGGMVDILSGVLSGANFGPWVPPFVSFLEPAANPVGKGLGHFVGAWRIDAFQPADHFKKQMDQWISRFKLSKAIDGKKVMIPGEPEFLLAEQRVKSGIPLHPQVVEDLQQLAKGLKIEFPTAIV